MDFLLCLIWPLHASKHIHKAILWKHRECVRGLEFVEKTHHPPISNQK